MLESFKIASALKSKNLSVTKMLAFIASLGPHFNLDEAIEISNQKKAEGAVSAPPPEVKEPVYSPEEIARVQALLLQDIRADIQKNISRLREVWAYRGSYTFTDRATGKDFKDYVYEPKLRIDNLSPMLRKIANNFGEELTYKNKDIHPSISLNIRFTPDTIVENVQLEAASYKKEVGFKNNYINSKDDKDYFKGMTTLNIEVEAMYFKNMSILQVFSYFGLNDLIDKAIIFGADIDYKESTTGKTAKDFYSPDVNVPTNYTSYIESLLDGTFEGGKYKIIYEKMQLEGNLSVQEEPIEASVKTKRPTHKI